MASKFLQRLTLAAVLIGGLGLLDAQTAAATRPVRRTARPEAARGFNLFAGAVNVMMNVNRIQCNINNIGETCVDPTNSPVVGGGYWPKGTPDQYIFNSGMMVAGLLGGSRATFPWAGDTVGAFIFDPRGDQSHGQGLTNVMNGLNAADLAEWPTAAYVNDPTLFNAALLGRKTVSQQDTWVRYWDGNVNLSTGRQHPMGLLIDQRGMMWNFPSGNQDIVYFLYRFVNITARDPAKYANLTAFGYSAQDVADIVAIANQFQDASEARYNVSLPDSGWTFTRVFAAFGQDPDVGASGQNYSTAILPFAMGVAYKSNFYEPTWAYPPDIFGAPFAAAPGFEGVKYLKSPTNPATGLQFGITMFTNTTNGAPFPDRVGVQALWRLLSNNLLAQDGTCNAPVGTPMCQLVSTPVDARFIQASGPLSIAAGQSAVIVVAYVHAAPVAAYVAGASSSFDLKPGIPGTMDRLATGVDTIRTIERASGISASVPTNVSTLDANANGLIEQGELATVSRSLLNKGLVAQAVFDAKFLLPFSPESPRFFTIPGDGQITLAWRNSATETAGDPYFVVASDVLNSLYDPNFRRYDVEGYRIWRGRSEDNMEVIAAFDYSGTTITDRTGQFFYPNNPNCAPELAIVAGCPVAFNPAGTGPTNAVSLVGEVIQVPPGGRVQLASGSVLVVAADTAVIGGGNPKHIPGLTDNGVPFVYVDRDVRNGFRYFYSVTAFDINSVKSGPSSLESPLVTQQATPRVSAGQETAGSLGAVELLGRGTTVLDPTAALPTLNATTGIFSGPMPPTDALTVGFGAFLPQVLAAGNVTVTVDSIVPGEWTVSLRDAVYWFTGQGAGAPVKFSARFHGPATGSVIGTGTANFLATGMDSTAAARFGGDQTFSLYGAVSVSSPGNYRLGSKTRAGVNGDPEGASSANGPRWWAGAANENTNDPNGANCVTVGGGYSCVLADLSRNAGAIAGINIMHIVSYNTVASSTPARNIEGITSGVMRAADFKWYWGANGAVDSVVDVTHNVRVPFSTKIRASWGILNDSSFVSVPQANTRDASNAKLTWTDYACVDPAPAYLAICGGAAAPPAVFQDHARLSPVAFASSAYGAAAAALAVTGNGFILYLNGQFFLMQMAALPAAGTVWNMRDYSGNITGNVGSYAFVPALRPPAVPGLRARISYEGSVHTPSVTTDSLLALVHTVPDPYYVTNALEITASTKVLRFVNLPSQAIIRIYSLSGVLVNVLTHNNAGNGGEEVWNLRNRNNQFIASGVYFYHVETPDGRTKIGRFTVVNYAQ
jgi:hypothetical protein